MQLVGQIVYGVGDEARLQVINVRYPATPVQISRSTVPAYAKTVLVIGRLAYVGNLASGGLDVFDVSNPARPMLHSQTTTISDVLDIVLFNSQLVVAGDSRGVHLFQPVPTPEPTPVPPTPTPTPSPTTPPVSGPHRGFLPAAMR